MLQSVFHPILLSFPADPTNSKNYKSQFSRKSKTFCDPSHFSTRNQFQKVNQTFHHYLKPTLIPLRLNKKFFLKKSPSTKLYTLSKHLHKASNFRPPSFFHNYRKLKVQRQLFCSCSLFNFRQRS